MTLIVEKLIRKLSESFNGSPLFGESMMTQLDKVKWEMANTSIGSAHSIAELVQHIIYWRVFAIEKLTGNVQEDKPKDWVAISIDSVGDWSDLMEKLNSSQKELVEALQSKTDDFLMENLPNRTYTYEDLVEGTIQHDVYHLGQIGMVVKGVNNSIKRENLNWRGPFSWPSFEEKNHLQKMPDLEGVYIFTFKFKTGYLVYCAGVTNSTKRRFSEHTRHYNKGEYNVLDVKSAEKGVRSEIWHGWQYAKSHQEVFAEKKKLILEAVDNQLESFCIFIAEVSDVRKRKRIEAAIMHNIYESKEYWSEVADKGMSLSKRFHTESPLEIRNICSETIYGLPEIMEI